jgi:rod shape-determining protein MreB
MSLRHTFNPFSADLGIDLGTANTLVYARGCGVVVNEPSVISFNRATGKVEAGGGAAREMLGRTPRGIVALEPLKDGVIAHLEAAQAMLRYFIRKAQRGGLGFRPRVVIGVPGDTTEIERRAVEDAAYRASARSVRLVKEPIAAAVGAGMPIGEPAGNMVVDIGSGTTDIAVLSLSGVAYEQTVRVAGNEMDEAIIHRVKQVHNLEIGKRTAERIKITLGTACSPDAPLSTEVRGRDPREGLPRTVVVTDKEVREALAAPLGTIVGAVRAALERTSPELSADIIDRGIVLTGGGALIRKLDALLAAETGIPVSVAPDPLMSVAYGAGRILEDPRLLNQLT